jgi:hypothetical protein
MRTHLLLSLALFVGCVGAEDGDARDDSFTTDGKADVNGVEEGSPTALAVISVVNHSTETQLHDDVGLSSNAAENIAAHGEVQTLAELDDIPYVGSIAFHKLIAYAQANGLIEAGPQVGTGILLDCNTSLGPDQQVTVIGDGTKLTLRELTTSGSQVDRTLALGEWTNHKINLRDDGSTNTLTKESGDWIARSSGGGFNEVGAADCWVDKSH